MIVRMDFNSWLVGLIDGEGSFQINKRGIPSLTVMVSHRDAPIVDRCREVAGVGRATHYPNARKPVSAWVVKSKDDLERMVTLLDAYPLQGKKQHEYRLWREAVALYRQRRVGGNLPLTAQHNAPITERLMALRVGIMSLR